MGGVIMKQLFSKIVCLLLILTLLLPGLTPPGAQAVKDILPAGLEGKTISILGDSISTFAGVSNDPNVNETLAGSAVFYQDGTLGVSRKDTWWQQTADQLGMKAGMLVGMLFPLCAIPLYFYIMKTHAAKKA
jgi:hypothetical protein